MYLKVKIKNSLLMKHNVRLLSPIKYFLEQWFLRDRFTEISRSLNSTVTFEKSQKRDYLLPNIIIKIWFLPSNIDVRCQ